MGLPAGQYSMQCWHSTQNPDDMNRPRLMYQCFQLIKAMQKRFANREIAIPSTESVEKKGIEICIFYPAGANLFADIADFLTNTAISLGLDYQKFVKQDAGLTRYFDQRQMDNISLLDKPVPEDLTEKTISESIEKAAQFHGYQMNDSWKNTIPAEQRVMPFQITRSTLQRFHTKEGNELAAEIKAVMEAIQAANAGSKSAYSIIAMIADGAAAIASIAAVGDEIAGSIYCIIIMFNSGLVGAAIASSAVLLGIVAGFAAGVYLMLKDASNVLLVINDSPNDLMPKMEWIENGGRRVAPEMIPAAVPNSDFVSCGLFFYSKYQVQSVSLGTYGSAFGVSFGTGDENFSIGMDCPNSLLGGNNSIEVHNQEHAQRACQMALDSGCLHGWTDKPRVDVKIADHWGNVNFGRAIVMKP
ncbi:hypothetical protein GGR56DRAFT_662253 [Xylariaceae sp. FL0804]|nr:hypothetical protein GGR56DRAFT_662253 [Xylariaceae sp. FL0804]